jgi:hypothetical protein
MPINSSIYLAMLLQEVSSPVFSGQQALLRSSHK